VEIRANQSEGTYRHVEDHTLRPFLNLRPAYDPKPEN
jgi:hypothetical protein